MTDTAREKYLALMTGIEDAEDRLAEVDKQLAAARSSGADASPLEHEFSGLKERLSRDRVELARMSDGCGRPHPESRMKKT